MKAEIGIYNGQRWEKFPVKVDGNDFVIVDEQGRPVSDKWVEDLPTVLSNQSRVAIADNPSEWLTAMSRRNYSQFGVRLI